MSAGTHDDPHGHHDDAGGGIHATFGGYVVGFALSVLLTAIPFWLVMAKVFANTNATIVTILAIGAVQIVVHMIYFLHMTPKAEGGWSMLALMFTIVMVIITLSGSLWVMFHLKSNMMPVTEQQVRSLP